MGQEIFTLNKTGTLAGYSAKIQFNYSDPGTSTTLTFSSINLILKDNNGTTHYNNGEQTHDLAPYNSTLKIGNTTYTVKAASWSLDTNDEYIVPLSLTNGNLISTIKITRSSVNSSFQAGIYFSYNTGTSGLGILSYETSSSPTNVTFSDGVIIGYTISFDPKGGYDSDGDLSEFASYTTAQTTITLPGNVYWSNGLDSSGSFKIKGNYNYGTNPTIKTIQANYFNERTFNGWSTNQNNPAGGGSPGGSTYSPVNGNKTFYATWNPHLDQLIYENNTIANLGQPNSSPSSEEVGQITITFYDESTQIRQDTRTKTRSYSFTGWYDSATNGIKYNNSDAFTEATTVYAHWSPTDQQQYDTVTTPILTKNGYTFLGWGLQQNDTDPQDPLIIYTPGQSFTPTGNTILYAKWIQTTYLEIDKIYLGIPGNIQPSSTSKTSITTQHLEFEVLTQEQFDTLKNNGACEENHVYLIKATQSS